MKLEELRSQMEQLKQSSESLPEKWKQRNRAFQQTLLSVKGAEYISRSVEDLISQSAKLSALGAELGTSLQTILGWAYDMIRWAGHTDSALKQLSNSKEDKKDEKNMVVDNQPKTNLQNVEVQEIDEEAEKEIAEASETELS